MSGKAFLGRRCASVSKPPALAPISKIILWIDNENCYEAGDDTGREMEITCPYGTQAMAEDLLQKLGGYAYRPLEAGDALLDPAAELGDSVTVDGRYTLLAGMELSFDSLMTSRISAPGAAELPQEYSFSSAEKILNRKIARNRSLISKTAEEIRMEVSSLDKTVNGYTEDGEEVLGISQRVATLELGQDGLKVDFESLDKTVNGYTEDGEEVLGISQRVATLELGQDGFKTSVEGAIGTNSDGSLKTVSSSIEAALEGITLTASSSEGKTTFTLTGAGAEIKTQTLNLSVDAAYISGSIYAGSLHLGGLLTIYDGRYSDDIGGYIGYDSGFYNSRGIGIRSINEYSQMVCTEYAARLSYSDDGSHITQVVCGQELALSSVGSIQFSLGGDVSAVYASFESDAFYPYIETMTLGKSGWGWADVYAAGTSMSDLLARVEALENA